MQKAMTLSPKKYVSHFTSSTSNRGVEAKEIEIANTRLDLNASNSLQFHVENSRPSSAECVVPPIAVGMDSPSQDSTTPVTDETASYIQVVVQKHRRKREPVAAAAAQTSPRLPAASSPITKDTSQKAKAGPGACGDAESRAAAALPGGYPYMFSHPLLFTYPGAPPSAPPPQHYSWGTAPPPRPAVEVGTSARSSSSFKKLVRAARHCRGKTSNMQYAPSAGPANNDKNNVCRAGVGSTWKKLSKVTQEKESSRENSPERVQVYYFERGCAEYLAGRHAAPGAALERVTRRAARAAQRAAAELLAVPACLLHLPVALALQCLQVVISAGAALVLGALRTASDHAIKPALVTLHDAILQPPLLLAARLTNLVREVARPLAQALGDAVEPLARLLRSCRLVAVERGVERGMERGV